MIRSLFLDIDGTLVSFKTHRIPASTIEALTRAKANGTGIYISTGRPMPIITNLGDIEHLIDGYITTNGALCSIGDDVVACNPIRPEDVRTLLDDADRYDYTCLVVGETDLALYNPKSIFDQVFREELGVTEVDTAKPAGSILEQRILQLSPFFSEEHERELMPQLPDCVSGRWHPAFTDVTDRRADKGKGLLAMADRLGLDIADTMAFGDGGNDLSIIRRAGIGVAMGNAGDSVKAAADYVTNSVDDDGVMNALLRFGVI